MVATLKFLGLDYVLLGLVLALTYKQSTSCKNIIKEKLWNVAKVLAVSLDPTGILKLYTTFSHPKCLMDS